MWEWFASARAVKFTVPSAVVQEGTNNWLKYRRKEDLYQLVYVYEVSEGDMKLCLVKSD